MAQLVIHLGISPAEYWGLRLDEQQALIHEWNRTQKRR